MCWPRLKRRGWKEAPPTLLYTPHPLLQRWRLARVPNKAAIYLKKNATHLEPCEKLDKTGGVNLKQFQIQFYTGGYFIYISNTFILHPQRNV